MEGLWIERWVRAPNYGHDTGDVLEPVLLSLRRRENDTAEVRSICVAEIEFGLFYRRVLAPFEIVGQTDGKVIDRIELGIDPLRQLQGLDRGISAFACS